MYVEEINLDKLEKLLDKVPVIADINPISTLFLDEDINIINSFKDLTKIIDSPYPSHTSKILVNDSGYDGKKFIKVRLAHDPFTPKLNQKLFDKFDEISKNVQIQSNIGKFIEEDLKKFKPDVVCLYLVDGLSYWDLKRYPINFRNLNHSIIPCLVDCPTLTETAFPNIIGNPSISERLYSLGYSNRLGFSYWDREDDLTNKIFSTFIQHYRISSFDKILAKLAEGLSQKTFVQILRICLDGYCHHQKNRPPIREIIQQTINEITSLTEFFNETGLSISIYLTADHGILWRDEILNEKIYDESNKFRTTRYFKGFIQGKNVRIFSLNGQIYSCLSYPILGRNLRIDEQGVHGGISFQESIVPLMRVVSNDKHW